MAEASSSPPQKLSRYRSQRKAQQTSLDDGPQLPQHQGRAPDDSFGGSKSRYRRRQPSSPPPTAPGPKQDDVDVALRPPTSRYSSQRQKTQAPPVAQSLNHYTAPQTTGYHQRHASPPTQLGAQDSRRIHSRELDSDGGEERRRRWAERHSAQRTQEPVSALPKHPSISELFPPLRPEDVKPPAKPVHLDGPPTSDQIRATKSMNALPKLSDDDDDEEAGGCFGLFKRKGGEAAPQMEKAATGRPTTTHEPVAIKAGGGGIVPGTDAPISAVNAGDRHVLVECGKSKTTFPVTPTTTPVDIIKQASTCMAERIDMKSAVLLEHFNTVGVQRPLRRYEHIRDVMNSWDTDKQNSLLLVDPGTGSSEAELSVSGVPKHKPGDESWLMSFSQKVGKWDKRLILLRSDGQVVMQKDPNKRKDLVNVCHLSDFDIYTPTQEKMKKKIRPPKKFCFAIKSQQKTSMFESTQNFVHFFCTNDRPTADTFYSAIQGWRSWYLVNVLGEGRKPKPVENLSLEKELGEIHRPGQSFDSHYQLGTFKPLVDMNQFDRRPATRRSEERQPSGGLGQKTSTTRRQQRPPGSRNNKVQLADDEPLVNLGRTASVDKHRPSLDRTKASPEEFLDTGLLGRSYSQRQREYNQRENQQRNLFSAGPNLLNGGYENREDDYTGRRSLDAELKRGSSTRQKTSGSGELQRSSSRAKELPKPLVDLTPQYREPPQHLKKGKGYNPDSVSAGGLIDCATSPEDPLSIPPSTDWRGRNQQSPLNRTDSLTRSKTNSQSMRRPHTSRDAFTGEGLLASSHGQQGWGGGDRGRGVMDGSRAKGPMLDLMETSKFVQGSLLNKVEKEQAREGPVIDRSREGD